MKFSLPVGLVALVLLASNGEHRQSVAQDPPPAPAVKIEVDPTPEPHPDFVPKLVLPERVDEGQPIEARIVVDTTPKNAKFSVEWESDAPHRNQAGPGHAIYLWASKGSTHDVRVNWVLVVGDEITLGHTCGRFTVGDPLPPAPVKTLAELAGKDAPALSAAYTLFKAGLPNNGTTGVYRTSSAAYLKASKLDANPAVPVVNAKVDAAIGKDDRPLSDGDLVALGGVLDWAVEELGAPTPVPPGPTPPGPSPITDTGLRVLITYDSSGKGRLPREQLALLDSPTLRAYLNGHCTKNGTVPEWRIVDNHAEFNDDQPVMKKLMAQPRAGDYWLTVTNGKSGESVPLPANEQAALALIGKYAQ